MKTRVLAGALQTTRQQLLRLDRESMLEARHTKPLEAALRKAVRGVDALVVSDYGIGSAGAWVAPSCAKLAKSMPVCVDSRYNLAAFRGVTLVKPNAPELAALANRRLQGLPDLLRVGRSVLQRQKLAALIVTRGRDGMVLFEKGKGPTPGFRSSVRWRPSTSPGRATPSWPSRRRCWPGRATSSSRRAWPTSPEGWSSRSAARRS